MFHVKINDFDIGASPEILVKVDDNKMEIRPIAGTRKRGKLKQDNKLARELLNDEKEKEHLMLLDLGEMTLVEYLSLDQCQLEKMIMKIILMLCIYAQVLLVD